MSGAKHTAMDVANWFLLRVDRDSGDSITQLKLQKLVYYAQAWHLANFNRPLFLEHMEAWRHGPVVPSLWQAFRDHGWNALPAPQDGVVSFDEATEQFLNAIYEKYGPFEAKYLESLTHNEDPWKTTRGKRALHENCSDEIPKKLMRDYYGKRIKKTWSSSIISN